MKKNLVLDLAVGSAFGLGPRLKPAHSLAAGFVRLTDKALREYEAARAALPEQSDPFDASFFHAVDHLETCLNALHRARAHLLRLREQGAVFSDGSPLVPSPVANSILTRDSGDRIERIRNAMEHMDERINRGKLQVGKPIAINPGPTEIRIQDLRLTYRRLAECITELVQLAEPIMRYREDEEASS